MQKIKMSILLALLVLAFSCNKTPTQPSPQPPSTAPAAPSNLQATVLSDTAIRLTWQDNSNNEDGYKIERKIGAGGTYVEVSSISANTVNWNDTGLSDSTVYFYRMRAYNSIGNSNYSNEVNARVYATSTLLYHEMVLIPTGEFQMGDISDTGYWSINELPVHSVYIDAFYIDIYEVTFEKYDAFCNATSRTKPDDYSWGRGTKPVIRVSWYDAIDYCNWLSEQEGLEMCYDSSYNMDRTKKGYRLPTEAEWEKAARGGLSGKRYPCGDSIDGSKANYGNAGDGYDNLTAPIGIYPANSYGLYDMAGNVWEWCYDWYGSYSSALQTNPTGPTTGSFRIARGGSWYYDNTSFLRCAYRYSIIPDFCLGETGFRCVRTQ